MSNYGRTVDGTGTYYTSFDLGVGYFVTPQIWITGELSIGTRSIYTQYIDHRFTGDHYYLT